MQNVKSMLKSNGINGSICVPSIIVDDLKNPCPLALPRLRIRVLPTELSHAKRRSEAVLDRFWKCREVMLAGANPVQRLLPEQLSLESSLSYFWDRNTNRGAETSKRQLDGLLLALRPRPVKPGRNLL